MDNTLLFLLGGILLIVLVFVALRQQSGNNTQSFDKAQFVSRELYAALVEEAERLRAELTAKEKEKPVMPMHNWLRGSSRFTTWRRISETKKPR